MSSSSGYEQVNNPLSHQAYLVCEVLAKLDNQSDFVSCSLVSRLWNNCATPNIWRAPYMKRVSTLNKFIRTVFNSHRNATAYPYGCLIQQLDLSRLAHNIPAAELGLISECCGALKYIDFSNVTEVRDDVMCRIAVRCAELRSIKLINLPHITDYALQQLLLRCRQLNTLAIGDCGKITENGLNEIANHGQYLTTLEIYLFNNVPKHTFINITKNCIRLKNLHLWDCLELDDEAALTIPQHLSETLESLILHNPQHLTDASLVELATRCKNLRHFGLEPYPGVTNATLFALADNAHQLESLKLSLCNGSDITNDGFLALAGQLKLLSKIQIQESRSSKHVMDESINTLIRASALTSLHIYRSSFSDSLLRVLATSRPPISDLCLFELSNITDQPLIWLFAAISGTLTSLQLSNCDQITEHFYINGLGVYGGNLRKLALFPSDEITNDNLRAMVHGCSNLREFYLASVEDADPELVPVIITQLRHLKELRIRNCPYMTERHVHKIISGCSQLKEFFFGRSQDVTQEFVDQLNSDGKRNPLIVWGP